MCRRPKRPGGASSSAGGWIASVEALRHLVVTIEDLAATGVAFVLISESIDTTSPTGRLLLGVLVSFAQFERGRVRERVRARLARARREGQRLGRRPQRISDRDLERVAGLSVREAAQRLGVPASRAHRDRAMLFQNPSGTPDRIPE